MGVLTTTLAADDLAELIETARSWALRALSNTRLVILDRSTELLALEGDTPTLLDALDRWEGSQPPLCPECGEQLHPVQIDGQPAWHCRNCGYRGPQ